MTHNTVGYAPVDADFGKLWIDSCQGESLNRFKIYRDSATAEANKSLPTDKVVQVKMEWVVE